MGIHEKLEQQRWQPEYPIESVTPKLNLSNSSIEELRTDVWNVWGPGQSDDAELEQLPDDDPDRLAANQFQYELEILPEEDPEFTIEVINAFLDSYNSDERTLALKMIPGLFNSDRDEEAMQLVQELLKRDRELAIGVGIALGAAMVEQRISDKETASAIVTRLAYEAYRLNAELEKVNGERDRALARAAKGGVVFNFNNANATNSAFGPEATRDNETTIRQSDGSAPDDGSDR